MSLLSIISQPNQTLSAQLSGAVFDITIRTSGDETLVDVVIDSETVISGIRAQLNQRVLPYPHMETYGNLIFRGDSELTYSNFGTAVLLYHIPPEDL